MDPQNRVSDLECSPKNKEDRRRQGPQTQKGKKTAGEKHPSTPRKAKKQKSKDSDEDDEEPQNEPGTSSNSQTTVATALTTLWMKTVSITMNIVHKVRTPKGPTNQEDTRRQDRVHEHRKDRKILQESSRAHRKRPRSRSPWIQLKTMKNL